MVAAAETQVLKAKVKTIDGKETTLAAYKPKAVLIVNTASQCGFTGQYKGLEELHKKFGKRAWWSQVSHATSSVVRNRAPTMKSLSFVKANTR